MSILNVSECPGSATGWESRNRVLLSPAEYWTKERPAGPVKTLPMFQT